MPRSRRDSVLFTVVVSVVVLAGAVVMALVFAMSGEHSTLVLAAVLAAVPVGPVLGAFLWLDRYEPEPRSLLVSGLAWGAFAATGVTIVVSAIGESWIYVDATRSAAVVAPVVEEAAKGIFLLFLLWWRRAELDGVLDGIVYAGMVGVGFAFVENILYLNDAASSDPAMGLEPGQALAGTFIWRCLISPFAHPLFTVCVGVGVGVAVGSRSRTVRFGAPVLGYLCAVGLHALWNASNVGLFGGFLVVYLVLMAPLFVLMIGFAVFRRSHERRMLTVALHDAAGRGLLPASDIGWLVDLRARRRGRRYARQSGGEASVRLMRDYQQTAVELGFLHYRYLKGTPPPDFETRGREYVTRLRAVRPLIAFPGQVVPTR